MSTVTEAFADALKRHPIAIPVIGALALTSCVGSICDVFTTQTMPKEMECVMSDAKTGIADGLTFRIGIEHTKRLSIPADQLQKLGGAPISYDCRAK
jgi:hypothetical protein